MRYIVIYRIRTHHCRESIYSPPTVEVLISKRKHSSEYCNLCCENEPFHTIYYGAQVTDRIHTKPVCSDRSCLGLFFFWFVFWYFGRYFAVPTPCPEGITFLVLFRESTLRRRFCQQENIKSTKDGIGLHIFKVSF